MREVTVVLGDESLVTAVEAEATMSGRSMQDIVEEALKQWLEEAEMDEQEPAEIDTARREWQKKGGTEARAFFKHLKEE